MTEDDAAVAVVAWARAVLPELVEGRSWITAQKTRLPDVVADVSEKAIRLTDDRFPTLDFQQVAALRVFEVEMAFMVEKNTGETADRQETEQLRDFGSRLEASLLSDGTLGDRVYMATPLATFNYRLPFVEYGDGTRGRQMTLTFGIAEPVQGVS